MKKFTKVLFLIMGLVLIALLLIPIFFRDRSLIANQKDSVTKEVLKKLGLEQQADSA